MKLPKHFLITGNPATGKSTLAKALEKRLNGFTLIEISDFIREHQLIDGYDRKRNVEVYSPDVVAESIEKFLKSQSHVILTGPPLNLNPVEDFFAVVLSCLKPDVLKKRMRARHYEERKIEENIEAELLGIVLGEVESWFEHVLVLDTCSITLEEAIALILSSFVETE